MCLPWYEILGTPGATVMISFKFNPRKTVEAAAMFLKLHGEPMNYMALLKLLYMADRISLQRIDQPISGDKYVSMDFGPVLSNVYDLLKGANTKNKEDAAIWSQYISIRAQDYFINKQYSIKLLKDPGTDELSEEEEEIIKEVYGKHGKLDSFSLAEITHELFPEWQDPHGTSIPIWVEDILKNIGKTPTEIKQITEEAEQEDYLDKILND
jgi:uncharacterized phage-associated protein